MDSSSTVQGGACRGLQQQQYTHHACHCRQPSRTGQAVLATARRGSSSAARSSSSSSSTSASSSSSTAKQRSPVVILPGFLSNNTTSENSQYRELANNLLALGHPAAEILPANTRDWLPTLSGGSFKWYIARLAAAVQQLREEYQSPISLVGISAGGWLARLALGNIPYDGEVWGLAPAVHTLVTCGTPHQSLEAYPFGRPEEAWITDLAHGLPSNIRTSLQYTNHHYPNADSLKPTQLVCVVGSAVKGQQFDLTQVGSQVLTGRLKLDTANRQWFVQSSYLANCGEVEVDGDGVCPVQTAIVPGAQTLVLPGVWHDAAPGKQWYGSSEVVPQWDKYLP